MLEAAKRYAKMGLAVFPVRQSKRPFTPNGCKDAKTDLRVINAWWKRWPDANIGIATGSISGNLIVVDLDVDDNKGIDGRDSLKEWERENGELPETWMAITGRGGYHLYFHHPDATNITNRAGLLDGVDIRGEGGYVVAPPSIHQNGSCYEWEYEPGEYDIADADATLNKLLSVGKRVSSETFAVPDVIEDGKRNDTLFKMAASLQSKGYADDAIFAAVMAQNNAACVTPLDEDEIRRIVSSASKYQKGELKELQKVGGEVRRDPEFKTYTTKDGDEKICQTIENIVEAIEWDPALWARIRYNTLAYAPYVYSNLPWDDTNGRKFREWTNNDDSNLKSYIEGKYGFKSMEKIMEALKIVSQRHKYNPVCDLLKGCHENWDGKKHIENLLSDFLGVEKTPYTIETMKLVMLGAISRSFYPGCKFDQTMILVGGQGIGKSTFVRYLALNDDWFNDNFNTLEGDKAPERLRGMWIVEMAELLATKKAKEVEAIKAFLTSRADTYRPPYERRAEQRPRSCIFIGTTNSEHFLTDTTGNRRFLPIVARDNMVKKSLFDNEGAVRIEFAQAWGEAMDLFYKVNCKPRLVLPKSLEAEALRMQEQFIEEEPWVGIIQEFLNRVEEDPVRKNLVCVSMILREALGIEQDRATKHDSNRVHDIMKTSIKGWERVRNNNNGKCRCGKYGVQICFRRKSEMVEKIFGEDVKNEYFDIQDPRFE